MPTFWDAYPDFVQNARVPVHNEFQRLAQQRHWTEGSKTYVKAWKRCVSEEFASSYGRDERRLDGWQTLCAEVGIDPVPESITQCKKALNGIWVNLVDLIDCRRTGNAVKRHRSAKALRKYTIATKKIFPKEVAKQNGFLRALLITVFD